MLIKSARSDCCIRYRGIAKRRSPRYKSQPAPKREHQLFSSWEIFWRNFYSKNQKVNASLCCFYVISYPLIVCFDLEQIRVSSRIDEYQLQLSVILLPYQEPVRVDVTLPATLVFPLQFMRMVLLGELSFFLQDVKHRREVLNVQATTGTEFQRAAELAGIDYLVHRSAQYLLDEVF